MTIPLKTEFRKFYDREAGSVYHCPGRVNLIGEHIDYNGGLVMPAAVSMGTWMAVAKNDDQLFRFRSMNSDLFYEIGIADVILKQKNDWVNYPLGVIHFLKEQLDMNCGVDMLYSGNLPVGAGLSSSASIEVCTAFALNNLFQGALSLKELALLAQSAEREFVGVNCGIMDQYAVAFGKEHHALLLNCADVEHEYLPFDTGGYKLLIINTNKPRNLVQSKYNERFTEYRTALAALQTVLPIEHLCEVNFHQLQEHRSLLNDTLYKRSLHVVSEQFRVGEARDALRFGQPETFGKLMFASHRSLKEFYEVTGMELDTIVDFAKTFTGCIGARMTGAGFGGCSIALVKKDQVGEFDAGLNVYYEKLIGFSCSVMKAEIVDGVRQVE
jgi:galactokinase